MLNSANVRVGVTGAVLLGPQSLSSAITTAVGPLPTELAELGYVDEGGVTEDPNKSTKDVKAWQKGATVRTIISEGKLTYKFRLIETNKAVIEAFYGATVTQTAEEGSWTINPTATLGRRNWVFEVVDGASLRRIWVPSGEITDTSAVKYASSEEYGYEVTLSAYASPLIDDGNARVWDTSLASVA